MTAVWITIGLLWLGTFAIKATGPVVLGTRDLPPVVVSVVTLLAPALLAALVLVGTIGGQAGEIDLDARLAGVAGAAAALLARLPVGLVVVAAAVAAAGVRALA